MNAQTYLSVSELGLIYSTVGKDMVTPKTHICQAPDWFCLLFIKALPLKKINVYCRGC